VHVQTCSITASKCIFKERRWVYRYTQITVVEPVTASLYLPHSAVDRHHLISISSYHTMKIYTLFFPTFGITCSVRNIIDPRNCMGSSMQSSIISSHLIPTLLDLELLVLMNSVWMSWVVRRNVDGGLPAFLLHRFTATVSKWCISNSPLNGCGLVLLRLCLSTICGQIDRMYI